MHVVKLLYWNNFRQVVTTVPGKTETTPETKVLDVSEMPSDHIVIKMMASAFNYPDLSMMTQVSLMLFPGRISDRFFLEAFFRAKKKVVF